MNSSNKLAFAVLYQHQGRNYWGNRCLIPASGPELHLSPHYVKLVFENIFLGHFFCFRRPRRLFEFKPSPPPPNRYRSDTDTSQQIPPNRYLPTDTIPNRYLPTGTALTSIKLSKPTRSLLYYLLYQAANIMKMF